MNEEQKYYERMNRQLDSQEKGNKIFWGCVGGYVGCIALIFGIMIAAALIGALWNAATG